MNSSLRNRNRRRLPLQKRRVHFEEDSNTNNAGSSDSSSSSDEESVGIRERIERESIGKIMDESDSEDSNDDDNSTLSVPGSESDGEGNDRDDTREGNDSRTDESDDESDSSEDEEASQNGFDLSQLTDGTVFPPQTEVWPPQKSPQLLLAIGYALMYKGRTTEAQKNAIVTLFGNRPKHFGRSYVPSQKIRFSCKKFFAAADVLYEWYTSTREEQKAMQERAIFVNLSTNVVKSNIATLTSAQTKEAASKQVRQGREILEWWKSVSEGSTPAERSSNTSSAATTELPLKNNETYMKMWFLYFAINGGAKNPSQDQLRILFPKRPRGHGSSKAPSMQLRCSDPDFMKVMPSLYDWIVASREEQMRKAAEQQDYLLPQRTINSNKRALCSIKNAKRIFQESPHLEEFVRERFPSFDWQRLQMTNNESQDAENSQQIVGLASSEEVRQAEVQRLQARRDATKHKKRLAGQFLQNEKQISFASCLIARRKAALAGAEALDSLHCPTKPMANIEDGLVQIQVETVLPNKAQGGRRAKKEVKRPKILVTVLRESQQHLECLLDLMKRAHDERDLIEKGELLENDATYEYRVLERQEAGVSIADQIRKDLDEEVEARKQPSEKAPSPATQHVGLRLQATPHNGVKKRRRVYTKRRRTEILNDVTNSLAEQMHLRDH